MYKRVLYSKVDMKNMLDRGQCVVGFYIGEKSVD